ncbi:unnamed protein product [Blumeria hordei]|uniref:SPT2 chromatin protein n=1 Tax=Blumeria hordei TaxID=2867405 RepID=A0A383V2E2_BLUHO|nr:unnamed protein product [Blumeria hordei]
MPIGDLLAQITGDTKSNSTQSTISEKPAPKRKFDDQSRKPVEKAVKVEKTTELIAKRKLSTDHSSSVNSNLSRMKLNTVVRPATARPSPITKAAQAAPSSNGPVKPLKKGSYAEIMARGKAAHATLGQVGKIQHKTIEKPLPRREREELKAQRSQKLQKNLTPNSKFPKPGLKQVRQANSATLNEKTALDSNKKVKKSALATTGYTGTARPKPGGTKTPLRTPVSYPASRVNSSHNGRNFTSRRGYQDNLDEYEDEEEEEEEGDYDSDTSDMEAAVFEVDEEEETAAKIARREDAEALAEENKLKREKEEKRKKMAALAKTRGGRSY